MKKTYSLSDGWFFTKNYTDAFSVGAPDANETAVRIPHSVAETPLNYFSEDVYQMVSGYRRRILIPEEW
ncbi:MAG: hypothetical protein II797_05850, partial [Clostridia bacterium]|nr:hypothetical protein [Clostridia bacterium]